MRYAFVALTVLALLGVSYGQGNIRYVERIDSFTDEDTSYVEVRADQFPNSSLYTNAIFWVCAGSDDDYWLTAAVDEFLGGDRVPIIYRFDSDAALQERWRESANGTAAIAEDRQANRFTALARSADRVAVGLTDYRGRRYEYTFSLVGLSIALERLDCVGLDSILASGSVERAYGKLLAAAEGVSYTEDVNIVYFDGLTVRFEPRPAVVYLHFEGTNMDLYLRILDEF